MTRWTILCSLFAVACTAAPRDDEDAFDEGPMNPGPGADDDTGAGDEPPPPPADPECGNGLIDQASEECDGLDLGGSLCGDLGYDAGSLSCATDCTFDLGKCRTCGNGVLEGDEACDGDDFGTNDDGEPTACEDVGDFASGTLACADDCMEVVTDDCVPPVCGDDIVNGDEVCDGNDLGGATCESQGDFVGGDLACGEDCLDYDTSECAEPVCGDGIRSGMEACDGMDFGTDTCATIGMMTGEGFGAGDLACTDACELDTSGCIVCGATGTPCTTDADCCPGISCFALGGVCL